MDREDNGEVSPFFIELKSGLRRTVGRHGPNDLGNPGAARFGKLEFLEQLADPPVPSRHLGDAPSRREVLELQARDRARIAGHYQLGGVEINLSRLVRTVVAVVDGVDDRLLERGKRIGGSGCCLRSIGMLAHELSYQGA